MPGLSRADVENLIPHRPPFLWIDEVLDYGPTKLVARKLVPVDLDVFRGHYPGKPILPGVLMCEACMQAGAILIAMLPEGAIPAGHIPVATRINNVKFKRPVRPGETLEITVELTEQLANAFFMTGRVRVSGETAVTLEFAASSAPAPA